MLRVGVRTEVIGIWALLAALALAATQVALEGLTQQRNGHDNLGAVASENKICSQIGIDLLEAGGNAADALVGTVACVGVIGMYHSGIGGGGYMLVRSSNGSYEVIDFREKAPAAAYQDMYKYNVEGSIKSGLASAVPGELRGLEYLHKNYGSLPWSEVLQPAIKVARYGFPVSRDLIRYMGFVTGTGKHDFLTKEPTWAVDFAPNGTRLGLGDVINRKRYADTLETIAVKGADIFYTGAMAKTMIRAIQEANGTMTLEDLENYSIISRKPVEIDYRGYRIIGCGAPASGAVALSVMKTIEGYDGFGDEEMLNLSTHRLDEAIRFGYGERASLGDPDYAEGIQSLENKMLDNTSSAITRGKISDLHTLNISDYDPSGFESVENHGTSQIATADASGMAISLTSTINLIFGSQLLIPETGIIMNNQMNDFSIPNTRNAFGYPPSPANYISPQKRPLSSLTPTIVTYANNSLYYVLGAAGGSRIITATIQNMWYVLDRNMSVPEAFAQPRMHDQLLPNEAFFEWSYDNGTVAFMKERGHEVGWVPEGFSSCHGLRRLWNGTFEAAGEPRQSESRGYAI